MRPYQWILLRHIAYAPTRRITKVIVTQPLPIPDTAAFVRSRVDVLHCRGEC